MKWPDLNAILKLYEPGTEYKIQMVSEDRVDEVIEFLRKHYPDIETGSESPHLDPGFYSHQCFLANGDPSRRFLPLVARDLSDELVGVYSTEMFADSRTLRGRITVVHPQHRRKGLATAAPLLLDAQGRASGAGCCYFFVTLEHPFSQMASENSDFKVVGIIPGFDQEVSEDGRVVRFSEAIYAKTFCPREELSQPKKENLTESVRELWNHLFDPIL